MTTVLAEVPLEAAQAARERIADVVLRTPLVRLASEDVSTEIYLKLENLQPIGSFKLRGASNAIALADDTALANGPVVVVILLELGVQQNYRRPSSHES